MERSRRVNNHWVQIIPIHNEVQFNVALSIRRTVFIEEQQVPEVIEIDEHDRLDDPICTHFMIVVDGLPAGTARTLNKGDRIKIQRFAILAQYRKGGYGSIFLNEIEQYHASSHYVLSAQEHAIPFYEKNGYSVCSEVYLEANIRHKDMEKLKTA